MQRSLVPDKIGNSPKVDFQAARGHHDKVLSQFARYRQTVVLFGTRSPIRGDQHRYIDRPFWVSGQQEFDWSAWEVGKSIFRSVRVKPVEMN